MINMIDKGKWLGDVLAEQGHWIVNRDGVWVTSDDTAVQGIIDSFDPLPYAKAEAIQRIKVEASKRAAGIYSFIDPTTEQAIGLYQFAEDLYLSITPVARESLSGRLLQFKQVKDAAANAITTVNALTDWMVARDYNAETDPLWP